MSRAPAMFLVALLWVLAGVGVTDAAVHHAKAKRPLLQGLLAPRLLSPTYSSHVQQVPALSWSAVKGAVEYEYQVSADPRFNSIVLGSGPGRGTSRTHNLAAALDQPITDGTYYWRVRGLTVTKHAGRWSRTFRFVKAWTAAAELLGPASGAAITWPSVPLLMRWTAVPGATEYIVTIATDPALSNVVVGSPTSPVKTDATVFALPGTLHGGQYYWAITPLDAKGHLGTRSGVASFNWSWRTTTSAQVNNLSPDPRVFDPQFTWAPVPGAARYEVEVNSAAEFPVGSRWCCTNLATGTSLSPTQVLANGGYYWRVRAIDASGNAGAWNEGSSFRKAFDSITPSIPDLTMSDVNHQPLGPDPTTDTPIVTWSAVSGAASYEVQVTPYVGGGGCNWASGGTRTFETASLAWTPLGPSGNHIGPSAWPGPKSEGSLVAGNTPYCVRVLARSDNDAKGKQVVSDWTSVDGVNQPAFSFASQPPPGIPGPEGLQTPPGAYLLPMSGSISPRTPLFTWQRVAGASSYYVVIARDPGFTEVVDVASTTIPAYAPRLGSQEPLNDQTTSYFWAVVPFNAKGEEFSEPPELDAPQTFNKSSVPPTPIAPVGGVNVSTQPTFSWSAAEGALNYTLQVSEDPTFGNPIDNAKTDSTAYTSSSTYPSDISLYWRVRANDANGVGLNWSPVQTFRRTLPVPSPAFGNPSSSEAIPALSWTPVTGATAYDVHVEEPDGSNKDFAVDSTSFAPIWWAGPGIWRWQARAEFPAGGSSTVTGGYFGPQSIVHLFAPPAGAQGVKSGSRIVISWNPDPYAKEYQVEVSTSDTFASTIDSHRVGGLSWAPNIDLTRTANRGTLYWRVAGVDRRGNLSPFAAGAFVPPRPKVSCVAKKVRKGKKTVKVCVAPRRGKTKNKH